VPRLDLDPIRDGYHFANRFGNRILPGTPFAFTTRGLCGGMAMAVLDHWRSGVPIPTHRDTDFGVGSPEDSGPVPAEGTRLRDYIYGRLVDSLLTKGMISRWITFPWIGPDQFHGWAVGSEFNLVRELVDRGRPAILGLWTMGGDPATGHQVLAYGYDVDPVRLYVYDPNHPDEESVLQPLSPQEGVRSRGVRTESTQHYRGYFWSDVYNWDENPFIPRYIDLAVTAGVAVETAHAHVEELTRVSAVVMNIGEYPTHFTDLRLQGRGPAGQDLGGALGPSEAGLTVLQPGESRTVARDLPALGQGPGQYTFEVAYTSEKGYSRRVPAQAGSVAAATVTFFQDRQLVVDRWFQVPESATTPVDTGIDLHADQDVEFTGVGSIWAGVWFTGENGPEGWEDRIETKPNSPMHNTADAHPFALIGRVGGTAWFLIGRSRGRQRTGVTGRLELWINDDTPKNGSGEFRCRVQVWQ
jgi:hypothetical protein